MLTCRICAQDLAKAKLAIESLQSSLSDSTSQLETAQAALSAAQSAAAEEKPLPPISPDASALEARLAEATQELHDAHSALQQTQESAQQQIESMSSIQAMELASVEEDHVNRLTKAVRENESALQALQEKLVKSKEECEEVRMELVDAKEARRRAEQEREKGREGVTTEMDLKALHTAHEAKMREVEKGYEARIQGLTEVRFPFTPFVVLLFPFC